MLAVAAMLALTVDVGRVVVEKTQVQNACDAAALAGARVLLDERIDGRNEKVCRQAATQAAEALYRANSQDANWTIEFGSEGAVAFTAASEGRGGHAGARQWRPRKDAPGGGCRCSLPGCLA